MVHLVVVNILIMSMSVLIHFESLRLIGWASSKIKVRARLKLLLCVGGALVAHTIEVWLFALAYFFMQNNDFGSLSGTAGTLLDCVYFSLTTFATLGFGDIIPLGPIRYLTGLESLTGLVLISWTASFLIVEMERYWKR